MLTEREKAVVERIETAREKAARIKAWKGKAPPYKTLAVLLGRLPSGAVAVNSEASSSARCGTRPGTVKP